MTHMHGATCTPHVTVARAVIGWMASFDLGNYDPANDSCRWVTPLKLRKEARQYADYSNMTHRWHTDNKLRIMHICENQPKKLRICTFQQVSMTEV